MSETFPHTTHGEITPRLKDLIDEASRFWRIPVTLQMVSRATGLNIKIIRAYYHQGTASYSLKTVGMLRWFFQCTTDSVIAWRPPDEQELPPLRVGLVQFPRTIGPTDSMIRNMIPTKLARIPIEEIKEGTGLSRNTVHAMQNQSSPPERIRGKTLAAVCDFLSQREGRRVAISELLVGEETIDVKEKRGREDPPSCSSEP